jgi:hypothetical protein
MFSALEEAVEMADFQLEVIELLVHCGVSRLCPLVDIIYALFQVTAAAFDFLHEMCLHVPKFIEHQPKVGIDIFVRFVVTVVVGIRLYGSKKMVQDC